MSTSPLRIDRARATPAKPHLDKLPKFDHSLHFDPSLGVDDSIAREGSLETSSTATDVQNPLRQSISRDVSSSTSPTKRPSMLDITAPYTGEAPSQQDEEIFTAEQESDIVDYINEAQEQDEEADWPLYPSKDNLPDLYAIPQSFLQLTKPVAQPEFRCHHISMGSVIVPATGPPGFIPTCNHCQRIPATGVLYYCQFDAMNDFFDNVKHSEPPQGESKHVRYMHRLGVSASIIEQVKQGLFTEAQIRRLIQQKQDARRVIRRDMGMEESSFENSSLESLAEAPSLSLSQFVMYDRTRVRDFAYDLDHVAIPQVDGAEEVNVHESKAEVASDLDQNSNHSACSEFGQSSTRVRPRCGYQCCFACWQNVGARNFQRLDSIVNSDPLGEYLVELERLYTHIRHDPVIPVHIARNLGVRPVAYPVPTLLEPESGSEAESPGVSRYGTPLPVPPELPSKSPRRSLHSWEFPAQDGVDVEQTVAASNPEAGQTSLRSADIEVEHDDDVQFVDAVPTRAKMELMTKKDSKVEDYEESG